MSVEDWISKIKNTYLFILEKECNQIVITAPHHAPVGISELPCKDHSDSDENAGLIAYYTSEILNCSLIIAGNYFIDPNKSDQSDYFKKIEQWQPVLLVEIHGHGGKSACYDIEISSGSLERNNYSKKLAQILQNEIKIDPKLNQLSISGNYKCIHFKASKSLSIATDKWIPFHIELPKLIREDVSLSKTFSEVLAKSIKKLYDELKSHKDKG